ncbi:MAG: sigma-54 dependent transcriptional regulator [Ignavibacteriaceae bacterium]|jgi:DNA-binding NtrC family response regulator|nr:sigma-54 dependent transcriptional regulator [Ignavibacteriaceae bacterium]
MNTNPKILVCDDDETICYLLKEQLVEKFFSIDMVYDGKYAIENMKKKNYDLLLLDLKMPIMQGEDVLKFVKEYYPSIQVIILTADTEIRKAIDCIKLGAYDFITKPYNFDELLLTLKRALEHRDLLFQNEALTKQAKAHRASRIIGNSPVLNQLIQLSEKAAKSESNILIEGETGTGKELLADFIHQHSARRNKPFVVINCASLPDQLIESELFGYEKGAFTDAKTSKPGLVEIANGGTLFLDEIGEMSLNIQPKMLRFLENGEYRRVGGVNSLSSDVRVIGATNKNLLEEIDKKMFRRDLLFRLNVITLVVPPLRERKEDILTLANFFLESKSPIRSPRKFDETAIEALMRYDFPGNIRELEHIIERAIIFSDDNIIHPEILFLSTKKKKHTEFAVPENHGESYAEELSIDDLEQKHILKVLELNGWERTRTAAQLGISQKTLYSKIKKYHLEKGI